MSIVTSHQNLTQLSRYRNFALAEAARSKFDVIRQSLRVPIERVSGGIVLGHCDQLMNECSQNILAALFRDFDDVSVDRCAMQRLKMFAQRFFAGAGSNLVFCKLICPGTNDQQQLARGGFPLEFKSREKVEIKVRGLRGDLRTNYPNGFRGIHTGVKIPVPMLDFLDDPTRLCGVNIGLGLPKGDEFKALGFHQRHYRTNLTALAVPSALSDPNFVLRWAYAGMSDLPSAKIQRLPTNCKSVVFGRFLSIPVGENGQMRHFVQTVSIVMTGDYRKAIALQLDISTLHWHNFMCGMPDALDLLRVYFGE